jgi:hypothetical protein
MRSFAIFGFDCGDEVVLSVALKIQAPDGVNNVSVSILWKWMLRDFAPEQRADILYGKGRSKFQLVSDNLRNGTRAL